MTDRQRWDDETIARAFGAEARRLREAAARRLPSAETLLFRARLRERLEAGERAARLLVLYDRVALTASAAAALALVPPFLRSPIRRHVPHSLRLVKVRP